MDQTFLVKRLSNFFLTNHAEERIERERLGYMAYASIIAVKENCNLSTFFNFSFVDKEDILKEIKNFKVNKPT